MPKIELKERKPTWDYILNDLAFLSLETRVLYGKPDNQDRFDFEYQIELKDKEIESLQNILDNIGYQIEGIIRKTDDVEINKATGEILAKHNIELLKKILKMIVNKDVYIRSDKE